VTEGLRGFHACPPPPTFLTERRSMGDDVVLLIEESPGSFLPMLNALGRMPFASLDEGTAWSWTLGDE